MNQRRRGTDIAPVGTNGPAFYSGDGPPLASLGNSQDLYLNLATGDIWRKNDGDWEVEANFTTGTPVAGGTITQILPGDGIEVTNGTGPSPTVALNASTIAALATLSSDMAALQARQIIAGTGLTGGGSLAADRTLAADFGTAAGKVCQGNDARLSDARTPTSHASSHARGGSDIVAASKLSESSGPTTLDIGTWLDGQLVARRNTNVWGVSRGAYRRKPVSPNAFDFEAEEASTADLALLGFTFRRETATAGTMTRKGDIQAFRTLGGYTPLGNLEYFSSLIDGRLYLQLPLNNSVEYSLVKSVAVPTTTTTYGAILWASASPGVFQTGGGSNFSHIIRTSFAKDTGSHFDTANTVGTQRYVSNTGVSTVCRMDETQTVASSGSNPFGLNLHAYSATMDSVFGITVQATATNLTYSAILGNGLSGQFAQWPAQQPSLGVASGLVWAGFSFNSGTGFTTAAPALPYDYVIDFIRLYTGNLQGVWIGGL